MSIHEIENSQAMTTSTNFNKEEHWLLQIHQNRSKACNSRYHGKKKRKTTATCTTNKHDHDSSLNVQQKSKANATKNIPHERARTILIWAIHQWFSIFNYRYTVIILHITFNLKIGLHFLILSLQFLLFKLGFFLFFCTFPF